MDSGYYLYRLYVLQHKKLCSNYNRGLVRHSYTLQVGDTIWDVASNVSTSNDDVREVVHKILEDNKISNPSAVQAGQTIYIYLERKQ